MPPIQPAGPASSTSVWRQPSWLISWKLSLAGGVPLSSQSTSSSSWDSSQESGHGPPPGPPVLSGCVTVTFPFCREHKAASKRDLPLPPLETLGARPLTLCLPR